MFDSGVYSRDFLLLLPGVWRFSLSATETKSYSFFQVKSRGVCSMFDSGVYSRDFLLLLPGVWPFFSLCY